MTTGFRRWGPWLASLGLSGVLVAYLLSGIDSRTLVATFRRLAPEPLLAFAGLMAASILVRALRFWLLLGRAIPFSLVAGITLVRNLFVDLLPARLGELSFVYLIVNRGKRTAEEGVATMVVAMLLDLIALAPLLLLALLVVVQGASIPVGALIGITTALALLSFVAIRSAGPVTRYAARIIEASDWRGAHAVTRRLRLLAESLERPAARTILLPAFGLSLVLRLCKYGGIYSLALAVALPLGYGAGGFGFFNVVLAAVSAEVAAALPVHGLAGFGSYETAWTLSFTYLGFPREHAVVSGILVHVIGQVAEYALGTLALVWLMRPRWAAAMTRRSAD